MTEELEFAKELALQAGTILLKHFAEKSSVRWKGEGNPVTDADEEASRFIVDALRRRFPQDGILCEEEPDNPDRLNRARVWIIDPMDGTSEFVAGRPEFAVMIGLAVEGQPSLGVVYLPVDGKLYSAESGSGAFLEAGSARQELRVSAESDPALSTIAVSRAHDSAVSRSVRESIGIGNVIHAGGVGLKVVLICEKRAHLYLHVGAGTNEWDSCAPQIILHEAGGRMTDVFDVPLTYNRPQPQNIRGILASNGAMHDIAVRALAFK